MDATQIVTFATPVIVPLVIAGIKALKPKIPTWLLPLIAGPLGALLEYINHLVMGGNMNIAVAVLLGLAGVGVREVVDQLRPVSDPVEPK